MVSLEFTVVDGLEEQGGITWTSDKGYLFCPICEDPNKHVILAKLSNGRYEIFPECGCDEGRVKAALERSARPKPPQNGTNAVVEERPPLPDRPPPDRWSRAREPPAAPPIDDDIGFWEGPEFETAQFPEPDWLAPGLIPKGMLSMVVADPKIGKSVMVHGLCIAAPTAGIWLGVRIERTHSLYINWEDPPGLTRERGRHQMAGEPLPRGYFIKEPPFGRSVNDMRSWIVKKIEQHSIGLVVIDPLAIATRWKDENDPYETGVIMSNLQEIAVKTGAAVVAVHHSTKTGGEWGKEVRGSGGIFGAVMSLLSLKRKAEGLFDLDLINKINGEHKYSLRRDHLTLSWQVTERLDAEGRPMTAAQIHKSEEEDRCLALIRAEPGIEAKDVSSKLEMAQYTVSRYLRHLIAEKRIIEGPKVFPGETPSGRRPRGYWAIPERGE
jgi:hypothetical protein